MTNRNEKLEITKRLRLSSESEMSRDDLALMLEEELTKPEDEMDPELIQLILETLEDTPSSKQQHESWKQIEKKLSSKRQWLPAMNGLTRIAAIGVILVAFMFATYGTAQAFNWEFLLRLMKPFAETFMLYSGDSPETTPVPEVSNVYSDVVLDTVQMEFTSLEDCPLKIAGYPAKPVWMPERFSYVQGSSYSDMLMSSTHHFFMSTDGSCILDITVFADDIDVNSYKYEQIPEQGISQNVAGYQIAFYRNTDDAMLTASWIVDNAHYWITGNTTEEEISCILESMMK